MFTAFLALVAVVGSGVALPNATVANYNFFRLTRQWAPNFCYQKQCKKPAVKSWTIHGLWPTNANSYPDYCLSSCKLKTNEFTHLLGAMRTEWPTLFSSNSNERFWKHEYCKHGSCCTDLLPQQKDYFKETLDLHRNFDIEAALAAGGITPSDSKGYSFSQVDAALKAEFAVTGKVGKYWCRSVWYGPGQVWMQLLTEVAICIDKQFKIMGCPAGKHTGCNPNWKVYFLPWSVLKSEEVKSEEVKSEEVKSEE